MSPEEVGYTPDGASFAVLGGEQRPIVIWSVVNCAGGIRLVHFSFRSKGLAGHQPPAKYTAKLINGTRETAAVLWSAEDFEDRLKEGCKKH